MLFRAFRKWLQTKYFRDIVNNDSKSDVLFAFKRKVEKNWTGSITQSKYYVLCFYPQREVVNETTKTNYDQQLHLCKILVQDHSFWWETYSFAKSVRNEWNCWCDQSKLRLKEIPRVCWRERIRNWNKKFRQTVNSTKLTKVNYAHLISFSSSCLLTKVKPIDILPLPRKLVVFSGFHVRLCISPVHFKCTAVH